MSTTPPAAPPSGAADPKQAAFDQLTKVLNTAQAAMNNPANTPAAQDAARALWNTTNDQLDALDESVIESDTVSLEASASEMTPAMTQLKALQTQIEALGNDIKEGTALVSGIGSAISELKALGPF